MIPAHPGSKPDPLLRGPGAVLEDPGAERWTDPPPRGYHTPQEPARRPASEVALVNCA